MAERVFLFKAEKQRSSAEHVPCSGKFDDKYPASERRKMPTSTAGRKLENARAVPPEETAISA
jgi:hypothetical protein